MTDKTKLTPKQKKFCKHFVVLRNATDAALRAGYGKKNARQMGWQTYQQPYIKEEIERLSAQLASLPSVPEKPEYDLKPGEITSPEEILRSYTRDIRFDPASLFKLKNKKYKLIPIPELPKEVRMSLCGSKETLYGLE